MKVRIRIRLPRLPWPRAPREAPAGAPPAALEPAAASPSARIRLRAAGWELRAASIPGRRFEWQIAGLRSSLSRELRKAARARSAAQAEARMARAAKLLECLEGAVLLAERVRTEADSVRSAFAAIDSFAAALEIGSQEVYDSLRESLSRIDGFLREGDYPAAGRLTASAGRRLSGLSAALDGRARRAREQIDLWLGAPSVAARFGLNSFPPHLSPHDIQRWLEMRPRIEAFVLERAAAARRECGTLLSGEDPALALDFAGPLALPSVEAFAQAAGRNPLATSASRSE